jgi:aldose 1-epimerase
MNAPGQVRLSSETVEAAFLPELGARLHRLRAFGHDLLRTPDDPSMHRHDPFFWGAYVMAPWCNRAPAGDRTIAGRPVALTANFPDGSAIHGLVGSHPWDRPDDGTFAIAWQEGAGGWPWAFDLRLVAQVRGPMLRMTYRLANRSDTEMPAGLGLHPWFLRPVELRVPAQAAYPSNAGSPAAPSPVDAERDLRQPAAPAAGLDGTWCALEETAVEVAWPDPGIRCRIEIASSAGTLVAVASPADMAAVAVEPQTHGPDPFRRLARDEPDAPLMLRPGDELALELRWHFARARNVLASGGYG